MPLFKHQKVLIVEENPLLLPKLQKLHPYLLNYHTYTFRNFIANLHNVRQERNAKQTSHKLRNAKDYPDLKSYAVSRLQQQSCNWAITNRPQPNLESVCAILIEDGFAAVDLRPATLVAALRDKKKDYLIGFTKSAGLIKELLDKSLQPLLNNKSTAEMWTFLKNRFQYISPISIIKIFYKAWSIKLLDCKDVMDYTGCYQVAFGKIQMLITKNSWMSKKTVEMTLQVSLFGHLGREYSALVLAIETVWRDKTINLGNTILRIVRHAEITKKNEEDNIDYTNGKVLTANIYQAPKGTCITKKCVEQDVTTHYIDWCSVIYPELRTKYSLRQMQIKRSNRNLKKTNTPRVKNTKRRKAASTPEINSWQPKVLAVKGPQKTAGS